MTADRTRDPQDYLIFPLDVPTLAGAMPLVDTLAGAVGMFKIGLELFVRSGPQAVSEVLSRGARQIFLDLKLHDIPATVGRAMRAVADLGADLVTVHCGDSPAMLEAAVAGADGRVRVLAVTVLTSVSPRDLARSGLPVTSTEDLQAEVIRRASMAQQAGCDGVVCSGHEVAAIKAALGPAFLAVTPGIRPSWEAVADDDQQRIVTPAQAIARGSDYLVIGRPIRDSADPRAAARRIVDDIRAAIDNV